ncbi:MAG: aminoacyl-tRNA hydrolase [Bacteroidia bacterium]|nr:aminoacyl-tRNA hydrolase [Bacteroidia bacterium]
MISEERFRQILKETEFRASRSSGAGGQHVNKVSSRITLVFSITESRILSGEEKRNLRIRLGSRLTSEGILQVHSQESRSQFSNKQEAVRKLRSILNGALKERKKRRATRPTKRSKERRLDSKRRRSEIKRGRRADGDS